MSNSIATPHEDIIPDVAQAPILGVWDYDGETKRFKFSNGALKILKASTASQNTLNDILCLIHPDDRARVESAFLKTVREGGYFSERFQIIKPDGENAVLHSEAEAVLEKSGTLMKIVGTFFDVTSLTQTQTSLRESEERYRMSFEYSPVGIIIINQKCQIMQINDAFSKMIGYSNQELRGRPITHITYPDDRPSTVELTSKLMQGRMTNYTTEKRYQKKNGDVIWVRLSGSQQKRRDGYFGFALIVDITEGKHTKDLLAQKEIELAHMGRICTLNGLVTGIGHEINQPLAAVTNFSMALRKSLEILPLPAETRVPLQKMADEIFSQTMRAGEIIRRMKRLAAKSVPQTMPHLINELVHEVVVLIRAEARFHQVTLVLDLCEDLPLVDTDAIQIEQVLLNLVRNSIEAIAHSHSIRRVVTIRTGLAPPGVRVVVEDTGPGFDQCQTDQIFDAFYTTKEQGGGMGLSISRTIIEAHGGTLIAEKAEAGGAMFTFTLPLERETENA